MNKTLKKFVAVVMVLIICLCSSTVAFAEDESNVIIIRGDANGDGKVNAADALLVLRKSVGYDDPELYHYWGDLTGDGLINSTDALRILQIAVGSDEPVLYSDEEILKFYSDALSASYEAVKNLKYIGEYSSTRSNKDDPSDSVEIEVPFEYEWDFVNGVTEDDMTIYDICPMTLIPLDAVSRIHITEDGFDADSYYVSIDLKGESADFDNPIPENTWNYAADYVDCTISGYEEFGYYVYDATSVFPATTINATISFDGYVEALRIEIPFQMNMSICDPDGNHFVDAKESGELTDCYLFEY